MTPLNQTYPMFNPDAACPKCGRTPVGTRACEHTTPSVGLYGSSHWPYWVHVVGGHLHRKCGRCDHEWIELALEARMQTQDEIDTDIAEYRKRSEEYSEHMWPTSVLAEPEKKAEPTKKGWFS